MASNLPPGFNDDYLDAPCEVCNRSIDNCECPECPVCHESGNPACYTDGHLDPDLKPIRHPDYVYDPAEWYDY